jgi:hypothetical protein
VKAHAGANPWCCQPKFPLRRTIPLNGGNRNKKKKISAPFMYSLHDLLSLGHVDIQINRRSRNEMEKKDLKQKGSSI